ncbi:phage scaffolding protein [Amycolatopsis sp. Hca4]|uniref:phage scaffolding protein n=1 Tax=Amycolatopsis sp. Hca4 TaxID=2742131 RepID=UPI00158FEBDA|nr:phage scaffolding protein [Amycolatopsis sp. Hca4]QKV74543.1 phage scaffolding protein [Amycolatopsis sp. Hca4]
MAIKTLNSRFRRFAREAGGDGGTGGGGGTGTGGDGGQGTGGSGGGDGTGGGTNDEWKPPTKAEWEAQQAELSRVNAESASRRVKLKELQQQNETDAEKAKREADEAAAARYKPTAVKASARAALLEADAKTDRVGALAGLLDVSKLDIDDKGQITGLDAEVKRVKAEYPEFFKAEGEGEKPRPGKLTPGGKTTAATEKTAGEIIAARYGG